LLHGLNEASVVFKKSIDGILYQLGRAFAGSPRNLTELAFLLRV
jgi:hypothetical protein